MTDHRKLYCVRLSCILCFQYGIAQLLIFFAVCCSPQVLKYDIYVNWSGLFTLLLEYSMRSPNFANSVYWQLMECPRSSIHARRIQVLFEALLLCCGGAMRSVWRGIETEVEILSAAAKAVRSASPGEARDARLQVRVFVCCFCSISPCCFK